MFIVFIVNNLFETGFELNTREVEDASAFCNLPALHRGFEKQALCGLFCPVIFFFLLFLQTNIFSDFLTP
jgi:hypothetical protein